MESENQSHREERVSRAERRAAHAEAYRKPEVAKKMAERTILEAEQLKQDAEAQKQVEASLGMPMHRPERNAPAGSYTTTGESASVPGMEAKKLGAAMQASRERGAEDVSDPYAKTEQKSWWARAKESLFGPSAETVRQMQEESEVLPDVHAPEYVRQSKAGVRETVRHEVSVDTAAGTSQYTEGSTPFGSRAEIKARGEKMRASQALEDAEKMAAGKTESEWWNESGVEQLTGAWNALNKEMGDAHAAETALLSFGAPKNILEKYQTPADLHQFTQKPGFWARMNGDASATTDALNKLIEEMTVARKDSAAMKSLAQKSRGVGVPSIGKLPGAEHHPEQTRESEEEPEIKKAA